MRGVFLTARSTFLPVLLAALLNVKLAKESCALRAAAAAFFDTHGFVVYSGVLDAAECAATRAEIHNQLGANHPGFDPADCASWDLLSAKTYGLPPKQAIFTAQILRNRQNPKLIKAFSSVGRRTPRLGLLPLF